MIRTEYKLHLPSFQLKLTITYFTSVYKQFALQYNAISTSKDTSSICSHVFYMLDDATYFMCTPPLQPTILHRVHTKTTRDGRYSVAQRCSQNFSRLTPVDRVYLDLLQFKHHSTPLNFHGKISYLACCFVVCGKNTSDSDLKSMQPSPQ